ncbi:c-type cytochrome biogenesis protein CcmI [Rhodobacterales bacterium HKCCE3408]|nr:c-type cytochrome biogenesis protein CcmI [Rhodobacterales bacterium HKCCE3408]
MTFWIVAGAGAIAVALMIWRVVLRPGGGAGSAEYDLQVYRDQLRELDRDVARGVIAEAEAERARVEIGRRVLEADRVLKAERPGGGGSVWPVALGLVVAMAGAAGLYLWIGAPGYGDVPLAQRVAMIEQARASRPDQAAAEAQAPQLPAPEASPEIAAMIEQLREVMADRPDDAQGLALLAQNEARLGNFVAARQAQAHLIEVLGADATARHYLDLAEMMILAAGGYVSPEAETALRQGLDLDPSDGTGRYYVGLMFAQQGRPDRAFNVWRNLLAESPAGAPWVEPIVAQLEEVAARAGQRVDMAALLENQPRGPSAADIEAAAGMEAGDRAAMIEGMVGRLQDRLAAEGGPPEDWAQLIRALGVLGRTDEARDILAEARAVFDGFPDALDTIDEAAATLPEPAE